jgi:hypothetical protein
MKKRSVYDRALQRWFPKRYFRKTMRRAEIDHIDQLTAVKSSADREELEAYHNFYMRHWGDLLTSIEDKELIKKATRMDLSLDDIPMSEEGRADERPGHWDTLDTGTRVLHDDTRRALQKAIRERAPAYRKEKREMQEFYLKVFLGVTTAVTGLGGTIIGIIAFLKK